VLVEIRLDKLAQREPPGDSPFATKPVELTLKRIPRILLGSEPAVLNPL